MEFSWRVGIVPWGVGNVVPGVGTMLGFLHGVGNVHWGVGNDVPGECVSARPHHRPTCCMREGCASEILLGLGNVHWGVGNAVPGGGPVLGILHGEWEMCPRDWEVLCLGV